jgi:MFS superfamily sulfate permease-like transporter
LISRAEVWTNAFTIAVVASLETLLCVDALDRLDPDKRVTPTNRELVAQGIGNMIAGALGGIPMTAVIVRGSANLQAGAKTRLSAFAHGIWLLLAVLLLPRVMGLVPLGPWPPCSSTSATSSRRCGSIGTCSAGRSSSRCRSR